MMNSLSSGFYLPVPVVEDDTKKLFFLSEEHRESLESAYSTFDELKKLKPNTKISHFMSSKDINLRGSRNSTIRPVKSSPRKESFNDSSDYENWLLNKVFLRAERFFSGRPSWNIASTRHALLENYQFKGIGFTGISGRCDYPHTHGQLDIYLSLYETIMSWHLSKYQAGAQRVVALWKDDDKKNPQVLMLREAKSFRLAQIAGISLNDDEKQVIRLSLGINHSSDLESKFLEVIKGYARLLGRSYEIGSPTLDNLMLDGSLIDCSGIFHHNEGGWCVPLRLTRDFEGRWLRSCDFHRCAQSLIQSTHKTYCNLGLQIALEAANNIFWKELSSLVGENAFAVRDFFNELTIVKSMHCEDWENLLKKSFPEAQISLSYPEKSYFDPDFDEESLLLLISFFHGPNEEFNPYKVTDRYLELLSDEGDLDPVELANSIIRIVSQ